MQTDSSQRNERLSGTIERVTFHSPESGFCVLRVTVRGQRDLVTVVGSAAAVHPGEYLESTGHWINDATYGRQFRAAELRIVPPSTLEGIERYLASGMIRGIGPHFAKVLIEALGERVFEAFEREPERLRELPGIGRKRQERILGAWAEQPKRVTKESALRHNEVVAALADEVFIAHIRPGGRSSADTQGMAGTDPTARP